MSSRVLKYRVKPPTMKQWSVGGSLTTVTLAPGLEAQCTVSFMSDDEKNVTDALLVCTEGNTVEVPLRAIAPTHDVQCEGDLDLGTVAVEQDIERTLTLTNHGPREAAVKLSYESQPGLLCELERDKLGPAGTEEAQCRVHVKLRCEEAMVLNTQLKVTFADNAPPIRVQLVAQAMKHSVKLQDDRGVKMTSISLGTGYLGHRMSKTAVLVNDGPKRLTFRCHVLGTNEVRAVVMDGHVVDEPELNKLELPPTIRLTPSEGTIEPFQRLPVQVDFVTEPFASAKGFMATMNTVDQDARNENSHFLVNFGAGNGVPVVQVPLTARAVRPGIKLVPSEIVFPEVPSGHHMEEVVQVMNLNQELGAVVHLPSSAYFHPDVSKLKLEPGQTATVVVSYLPKSMGRHSAVLKCEVHDAKGVTLQQCNLSLSGQSLTHDGSLGPTKSKILGSDKPPLPEDFERPKVFAAEQLSLTATKKGMASTKRLPLWEKEDGARQFFEYHRTVGSAEAFSLEETMARKAHRDKYAEELKTARRRRKAATAKRDDPEDPVSLGLRTAAGLKEPQVTLPVFKDPLWRQEKIVVRPKHRPPVANDPRLLAKCRFKARPETEKEKVDCKSTLLGPDTAKISSCRYLDFGQVALGQSETRNFAVTNGLTQHFLVKIDLDESECEELADISPRQQVVPPGATAAFQCRFTAKDPGTFEFEVPYTINGQPYTFKTSADVVPVRVELNVQKLHFQFSPDNWTGKVEQTLGMDNPFDFPVVYNIESSNPVFVVEPERGVLEPKGRATARVRWTPTANDAQGSNKGNLVVHVRGELKPEKVACHGELPEGKMNIVGAGKTVDFEVVSVGVPKSSVVVVKNVAPHESQFQVLLNSSNIRASPMYGRVPAKGSLELDLTLSADVPCSIEETVTIIVRGGKPIKLPVKGSVVIPDIFIEEDVIDFGGVIVGGAGKNTLTLVNGSPVQGAVVLDLTGNQELSLELGRDAWSSDVYEHCPVQVLDEGGPRSEKSLQAIGSERSIRRRSSIVNQLFAPGCKYRITIMGNSKLPVILTYKPGQVGIAHETLQLKDSKGIPAPDTSLMAKKIACAMEGLEPKLVLSESAVDFGKKVVIRGSNDIPYSTSLYMSSHSAEPLNFRFAVGEAVSLDELGIFVIEPSEGVLQPDAPIILRIQFIPRESRSYSIRVPLYVNNDDSSKYLELGLMGMGSMPRLMFDIEEVILEPVPLGVRTSAQIMVVNDGYDNLDLKVKMPVDSDKVPLSVDFPDGTMIGVAKEKLPMVVSFVADKPTSFTASVELMDFEGVRYNLPVNGISDNSVMTTADFLAKNARHTQFVKGVGKESTRLLLAGSYEMRPKSDLSNIGPEAPNRFLARFLNATTMLGPFNNLREDALASKGKTVIDVIEILSGRPVPGKALSLPASRREAMMMLLTQYEKLLQHLTSMGALLSTTKPEFLLDNDDFARLLAMRETQGEEETLMDARLGLTFWEEVEANFMAVSKRAWNAVLSQVAKVLVLSRCSAKTARAMGVPVSKEAEKSWRDSNVYSSAEMTLLHWVSHWYAQAFPEEAEAERDQIVRFEHDFRNGKALYAVLVSHWPSLETYRDRMIADDGTPDSWLHNSHVVVEMMKQLELPFTVTAQELVGASCDEVVLLLAYLFQTLPQLAPKNTIRFSAKLGEVETQYVELSNPSNKAVSYYARLEGHSDFALLNTTVFLEPRATVHFPVQCKSSISKPVSGFLVFSSRRDGTAHGATLVFALESQVNTAVPVQKAVVDGTSYQMDVAEIEIRNPFPGDCDFVIKLEQHMDKGGGKKASKKHKRHLPMGGNKSEKSVSGLEKSEPSVASANEISNTRPSNPDVRTVISGGQPLTIGAERYPSAFGCDRQRLRLRQGAVDRLDLVFLPFLPGTHICHIVLEDAHFGTFRVEVVGHAKLPPPVSKVSYQCDQEGPVIQDVAIPFANNLLEGAKRLFLERHPLAKDERQAAKLKALDLLKGETIIYTVEQLNTHVNVPKVVLLKNTKATSSEKGGRGAPEEEHAVNGIKVELNPRGSGLYPVKVKLTSVNDVRIYDLTFEATKAGIVSKLEFNCPARHQVQQEIPMVNHSDKPLQVRALIQGETFFGPAQLTIDPGLTLMYPLSFRTNAPGNYYGKLELQIPATGEVNSYELRGNASAPLAEQHLELSCQARTETAVLLAVPNIKQTATTYQVLADLPFMTGEPLLEVPPGGKATYELKIKPPRSGHHLGSVMFSIDEKNYVWFTLDLDIQTPPATDTMRVACEVRKAVQLDITLDNPLDRDVTFMATTEGQAIFGAKSLVVPAQRSATYHLFCSPLQAGHEDCKARFHNEEIGEFWYAIAVDAQQPAPVDVPQAECEIGRNRVIEIPFSNPTGQEATFKVEVDNASAFAPTSDTVTVPGFGDAVAKVTYAPYSLGEVNRGVVRLSHRKAGVMEFNVSAVGTRPGPMEECTMSSVVGQSGTGMVLWANPFRHSVTVDLDLVEDSPDPAMKVLLKRTEGVLVPAGGTLQVPVSFSPLVHAIHSGELQIGYDPGLGEEDVLYWTYPIKGLAEVQHMGTLFKFSGKARVPLAKEMAVALPGVGPGGEDDPFTAELEVAGEGAEALKHAMEVRMLKNRILAPSDRLLMQLAYTPATAVSKTVTVILQQRSGGRWRFDVRLEIDPPDVVDTIEIQAAVGKSASVPIFLHSPSPHAPVDFVAMLSYDSAAELSVEPREGTLPLADAAARVAPASERDPAAAPLRVVFSPVMYGTKKFGKLVVQAGGEQYIFNLVGTLAMEKTSTRRRVYAKSTHESGRAGALDRALSTRAAGQAGGASLTPGGPGGAAAGDAGARPRRSEGGPAGKARPKNFVASNMKTVGTTGARLSMTLARGREKSGVASEHDGGDAAHADPGRGGVQFKGPRRSKPGEEVKLPAIGGARGGAAARQPGSKSRPGSGTLRGTQSAIQQMRDRMQTVGFL